MCLYIILKPSDMILGYNAAQFKVESYGFGTVFSMAGQVSCFPWQVKCHHTPFFEL